MAPFSAPVQLHSTLFSPPMQLKAPSIYPIGQTLKRRSGSHTPEQRSSPRIFAQFSNFAQTGLDASAAVPKEVPGSYGLPFLGLFLDKLNYFVLQGRDKFFKSKMQQYNSTVIRLNMPPGRPFFPNSRTIMLLDQKSIRVLFDTSKVEKKDVFAGTYMPSTAFTGGFRVLPYLDPSEPKHALLKDFCFEILKSNGRKFLPEFSRAFDEAATEWEAQLGAKGEAEFTKVLQSFTLSFLCKSILGVDPRTPGQASLGDKGPSLIQAWIFPQLAPQTSFGLPKIVEALLHTIPVPFFLVSKQYNKIYQFFYTYGHSLLDVAKSKFGLDRVEACHNLLFFVCFNTWGGFQILMPTIITRIASAGISFQKELVQEVRSAVGDHGGITMSALQRMELVQSTVYEVLRMSPPVPFQYGHAREDMIVESHDASYKVKKGELLGGYQGTAMRDPKVFESPDTFKPRRYMGKEGKKLLESLTWSNGPETREPTITNKQCAGKDFVILVGRLFVAELFLRYDFFEIGPVDEAATSTSLSFKALKKRV